MNSEKVKEIKKVIQETIDGKLSMEYLTVCEISCCPRLDIDKLFPDILTLITELESENERLEKELKQVVLCNKGLQDGINEYQADNKEMGKSNQELKDRIAELEFELSKKRLEINALKCGKEIAEGVIEVVEKEETKLALKQFAERLKEKPHIKKIVDEGWIVSYVEICNDIDETLEEMIEDDK